MATNKIPTKRIDKRLLYHEDDRIRIIEDDNILFATVKEYDIKSKQLLITFEDPTHKFHSTPSWVPITSKIIKVDTHGYPIKNLRRGRNSSKNTSETISVSSRTRSKSRERVIAEFSADESVEEINVKIDSPVKNVDVKNGDGDHLKPLPKQLFPAKNKTSTPINPKPIIEETQKPKLKDPEFSADEEEPEAIRPATKPDETMPLNDTSFVQKLIENNTQDGCSVYKCCLKSKSCLVGGLKSVFAFSSSVVSFIIALVFTLGNLVLYSLQMFLRNLPIVLTFLIANCLMLYLMEKKTVRLVHFTDLKYLPHLPTFVKEFKWTWSQNLEPWKVNIASLWTLSKYPLMMILFFRYIMLLKDYVFSGYKIILGAKPRITTSVNLRKIWLTFNVLTLLTINFTSILNYSSKYIPENKITPIIKSKTLIVHSFFNDGLLSVFNNCKQFYTSLLILAFFKSYDDFNYNLDSFNLKNWFSNFDSTVGLSDRFNVVFGYEMFVQMSFIVLASKNPTNYFIWFHVYSTAINYYLATRTSEDRQSAEGISIRRLYQNSSNSGFWFYFINIFKTFTFTNFWRFIGKTERITPCKYAYALFLILSIASSILKYAAFKDYPSEKKNGIYGHIRQPERLSEMLSVYSLMALVDFKFGNSQYFVVLLYTIFNLIDLNIQEKCSLSKSFSKWSGYFSKVPYRFVKRVF